MDSFLWEKLKEHVSAVPLSITEDLMVRFQEAVTNDANMLRHVQENSVQHTAVCLDTDGGCFKHLL
jgi:hypothetical protein